MKDIKKISPLFLFFVVGALFVTVLLPDWTKQRETTPLVAEQSKEANKPLSITTEIDFGDQTPVQHITEADDLTAYSALTKTAEAFNYEVVTEQYDFGVFIKSINGYKSSADKSWIYFVNGESGMVAADQVKLNQGDTVSWKYIPPEE